MLKQVFLFLGSFVSYFSFGQSNKDSIRITQLPDLIIVGKSLTNNIGRLESIVGTYIFDGKKSEVIDVKNIDANITDKTGRQLFAKVPGVFVYDMDGTGNQINISTRGLDPHRGWEFNNRKDGVLINSDMYGYPASHYSIPMESIERIEFVRGTASLQFGAQFGGMLNYVSKQGDTSKKIAIESFNTIGSYNLKSTFNSVGGQIGKLNYYTYFTTKSRDGYRNNEHTDYDAQGFILKYDFNKKLNVRAEWARSSYLYKIPGPLTDNMFYSDPTQSTRNRNYFSPTINVPSFKLNWFISNNTNLAFTSSAVIGSRNSVLFDKPATVRDTINAVTNQFNNRQVDIDEFNSFTNELRVLHTYNNGHNKSYVVVGVQYMNNDLYRRQQGKGTTGSDYNLDLVNNSWGRNLHFNTQNMAVFAENNLLITKKFSFNTGIRYEKGDSKMSGTIVYYPVDKIPFELKRDFVLLGTSFSYKASENTEYYGGISQTYRPMIFKDLIPIEAFEKVDPNLKDANGYNLEIGTRGNFKFLKWDITAFALEYNNRFGTLLQIESNSQVYTYRTNTGNSMTKGLEIFLQGNWDVSKNSSITFFTSTTWMDGKFTSGNIKSGTSNVNIVGNKIESVPDIITRNGITLHHTKWSLTTLYSYTSETFADALNTVKPSTTGAVGIVPAYGLLDFNCTYKLSNQLTFKGSVNNLTDKQYFTKRPLFYPGVGIWPSDGRNFSFSIILKI
jgi:Fe(3+) dicitrate transport protein